jgi:GntR family transcriptional regulator
MTSVRRLFDPSLLARNEDAPLYTRVKQLVQRLVAAGDLKAGDAIPGERDVADMLGVSRVTVRKAFSDLVAEGVLLQRRGSGTFVNPPHRRLEQPLSRLTSFTDDMRSRGLRVESRWLHREVGLPSPEEAVALSISPSEYVSRLHRLRLADGQPMAIELAVIPHRYLPDPQDVEDSLYKRLDARGVQPVRALQRLHAVALTSEDARLLGQPEHAPALFIERISYLADGRVVEYTRSYYRGDSYDFVAELSLSPVPQ